MVHKKLSSTREEIERRKRERFVLSAGFKLVRSVNLQGRSSVREAKSGLTNTGTGTLQMLALRTRVNVYHDHVRL